jgi:hypothetical protein
MNKYPEWVDKIFLGIKNIRWLLFLRFGFSFNPEYLGTGGLTQCGDIMPKAFFTTGQWTLFFITIYYFVIQNAGYLYFNILNFGHGFQIDLVFYRTA